VFAKEQEGGNDEENARKRAGTGERQSERGVNSIQRTKRE